jgi:hypothetical protein
VEEELTERGVSVLLFDLLDEPSHWACMVCGEPSAVHVAGISLCLVCRDERFL